MNIWDYVTTILFIAQTCCIFNAVWCSACLFNAMKASHKIHVTDRISIDTIDTFSAENH